MMLGRFFRSVEDSAMSFSGWLFAFSGIVFVRIFLENISSRAFSGIIGSDISTLVHYYLFYLTAVLSLIILLALITKSDITRVAKIGLFGLLCIWIPPIVDMIVSAGRGINMAYVFTPASGIIPTFLSFFGTFDSGGITPGIRLEVALVLVGVFFYVRWKGQRLGKSVIAVMLAYIVLFVLLSLPSIIAIGQHDVIPFFATSIDGSLLSQNFVHQTVQFDSPQRTLEIYFNAAMSYVYYLMLLFLIIIFALIRNRRELVAVLKNSRPERVLHYWLLILGGIVLVATRPYLNSSLFDSWLDILTLIILAIAFYCAWMFAVGVNDIEDRTIDEISNAHRPLISGELTVESLRRHNFFFLMWAVLGGFLAGHYALFMILTFTALYYIYSAAPLRLKRFPILNPFIVSLCCLSAVMAGFFTVSADPTLDAFSIKWLVLIVLGFTLGANIKDIKDIEGDRANNIHTLPVLLGEKKGKRVIGAMVALEFFLIPLFLDIQVLWLFTPPIAALAYYLVNRKTFRERDIFILYLIYMVILIAY